MEEDVIMSNAAPEELPVTKSPIRHYRMSSLLVLPGHRTRRTQPSRVRLAELVRRVARLPPSNLPQA
jgi:hypothetical protein